MNISDCRKLGRDTYSATVKQETVKAVAMARQTTIRRYAGAYEVSAYAVNTAGAELGSKQRHTALNLKCQARDGLSRALDLAGWTSEWVNWGGTNITLWWPPRG